MDPRTLVLFPFSGAVRRTVIDWKEEGRRAARERVLAWMAEGIAVVQQQLPGALVVPVPSSRGAERARGGRVLLDALRDVLPDASICADLVAARPRRDQAGLSRAERRANLEGSMRWDGPLDRPLIIADDIVTSGATLREAARAVRRAAAVPVLGFGLARR